MKILYIADSTSIHTQRWLDYFLKKDFEIHMITLGRKTYKIKGVNHVANFDKFYYNSIFCVSALYLTRKIINEIRPQVLHAHFVHQYGWLAALSKFHPFIMTAWGTDILNLPRASRLRIGKYLTTYTLRTADVLTATSEYLKREMIKLGAKEEKVHVIYWGVDIDNFRPNVDTAALRKELKISSQQPVVLSNRNQIPLYNNDIVIKAMCRVLKRIPQAVLILQNSGGDLENQLKCLAKEVGIETAVRFLPHFPHHELPALYAMADVYVSVPSWDAGPVSLKEAMICGAVPIISAVAGPMEWVKDEVNGRVIPVGGVEILADAICDLIDNPSQRERFNRYNLRLITEKADHNKLMAQMETVYHSMIR
jgi:glycosyltransferase involved in cell wall biosynthesis